MLALEGRPTPAVTPALIEIPGDSLPPVPKLVDGPYEGSVDQ